MVGFTCLFYNHFVNLTSQHSLLLASGLGGCLLLSLLELEHLLHNLLLLNEESANNALPHHSSSKVTAISPVHSLVLLADVGESVRAQGGEAMDTLSRDRADRVRGLFLKQLELQLAARGLDLPLLVRLGSKAMLPAVSKPLHHPAQLPKFTTVLSAE